MINSIVVSFLFSAQKSSVACDDFINQISENQNRSVEITDLRDLAEKGNPDAQFRYGQIHAEGSENLKQDSKEAVKWFRKAADQNYAPAQNSLGQMYLNGCGVEQNDSEAIKWFRESVKQNNAAAQQKNPTAIKVLKEMGVTP